MSACFNLRHHEVTNIFRMDRHERRWLLTARTEELVGCLKILNESDDSYQSEEYLYYPVDDFLEQFSEEVALKLRLLRAKMVHIQIVICLSKHINFFSATIW